MLKILLTNDDGIYADGIYAIYKELVKLGDVIVVAPDSEKSSISHAITLSQPLFCKKISQKNKFNGFGINGTPADCVKLALKVILKEKPNLIVSGINLGPNDGCSVFYSGTVAGAREGCLSNIPSIALSLDTFTNPDFSNAAKWGIKVIKKALNTTFPNGTFLNINIPNVPTKEVKGIKYVQQGLIPIHGVFKKQTDPNGREYYWMSGKIPKVKHDDSMDTSAVQNNYVTVVPIKTDSTDYVFLKQLKEQ